MKYRKKPVVIEAFQMTEERRRDDREWPDWLHIAWDKGEWEPNSLSSYGDLLMVRTMVGVLVVSWGDWIVQHANGSLDVYKSDAFEATYKRVDD